MGMRADDINFYTRVNKSSPATIHGRLATIHGRLATIHGKQ